MKSRYTHITLAEREIIRRLMTQKHRPAAIARMLGKNRSTIRREIARNTNAAGIYYEKHAHAFMLRRRLEAKAPTRRIDTDYMLQAYVEGLLKKGLSPEQIAGYMVRSNHPLRLCHRSIYAWVHRHWQSWKAYLRFKGRPRALRAT